MRTHNYEAEANKLPIDTILLALFDIDVPGGASNWKTHCPLGYEHSDGGASKSVRVYSESNSAWCFSHSMKFTPLSLWKLKYGGSRRGAAKELLKHFDVDLTPTSPEERWNKMNETSDLVIDPGYAMESLVRFAQTLPEYASRQFEPSVLELVTTLLDKVGELPSTSSYDILEGWLTESKRTLLEYWRTRGWI